MQVGHAIFASLPQPGVVQMGSDEPLSVSETTSPVVIDASTSIAPFSVLAALNSDIVSENYNNCLFPAAAAHLFDPDTQTNTGSRLDDHNFFLRSNVQKRYTMPAKKAPTDDSAVARATTLSTNIRGKGDAKLRPVPRTGKFKI